ncbi:MAG TPA: DUF2922 domain-containing protein, partial [Clostridiaceae bacterium]|nr:DUF2922 domain-containing protein [Clostridiaceae bacterium]
MNTLTMTFLNKEGKNFSLRLPKVRTDITEVEVEELMTTILTKNLLFVGEKELESIESASIN